MSNNTATTHELIRHLGLTPPPSFELRELLGFKNVKFSLKVKATPFSIMTQNMALMVFPAGYSGTNREGAVKKIIERIKALSPDVIGLCEVFANDERDQIRNSVKNIYPFSIEGPDEADFDSDGGCLLLSKHQTLAANRIVFSDAVFPDSFANKGVLHMRIKKPGQHPYEIFYSHTQNIEEIGGQEALYSQLAQMGDMIERVSEPGNPIFILGDLNIPGEIPRHHNELITRLGRPVDLWLISGGSAGDGFTFVSDNNFYEDPDDKPDSNQRLDYILLRAEKKIVPILDDMQILRFKLNGRDLSDHFGLRATFEQSILIDF